MVRKLLCRLRFASDVAVCESPEDDSTLNDRYSLWHDLPQEHVVLFLDFGGVLHTKHSADYALMNVLERLLDKCPALYIVIIDPIRNSYSRTYLTALFKAEYFDRLLGITQDFSKGMAAYHRAEECQDFVFTHRIKHYLIVDDDAYLYPRQFPFIVNVDGNAGLNDEVAQVITDKYAVALQASS